MRKINFKLAMFFVALFTCGVAVAQNNDVKTSETSTIPTLTVLEEDFSKWTAGSFDEPDRTELGGKAKDYKIPDELMAQPGWVGASVFQAGGACGLMMYYSEDHGKLTGGYIDTPEMELYGTVVLTLRARRMHAGSDANMRIALCDNYEGPQDDRIFNLTDDWAEYRFETNKALFSSISMFQIEAWEGGILIDDVKITRKRDIIETPYALEPINNSATSFTACWEPTTSAKTYVVNVYRKEMPAGETYKGTLVEGFDNLKLTADGKIDTEAPNYPEGWSMDMSTTGEKDVYTEDGWYNSGKLALCFDAEGKYVESPTLKAPLTGFSFWVRPSSMEYETNYNYSLLAISIFHRNTNKWETIANMPNYYVKNPKGEFYSYTPEQLGDDAVKVKIEMIQRNSVSFAVDDITLDYCTQLVPVTQLVKEVADTFLVVNNIDQNYEYYYNVSARDGELHSLPSDDVWVNGVVGLKAEALPATDITSDAFTANWGTKATATSYKLNVYKYLNSAPEDMPNTTLLYEDFNNVKSGTLKSPENPYYYNLNYGELGLASTEWQGQLPLYVEGMVGANYYNQWMKLNGLVSSPKMSLTANGGAFDVEVTAYGTKDDVIYVMLMNNPFEGATLAFKEITIAETNVATKQTVHFDAAKDLAKERSNVYVVLMSSTGNIFFVDDIAIRQDIKKGDAVYVPYRTVMAKDDHYTFTGIDQRFGYQYDVVAIAHKSFTDYKSDASDLITVATTNGIKNAEVGSEIKVENKAIEVGVNGAANVVVYDMTGRVVASTAKATGNVKFELPSAVYIVKVGDKVSKVLVP